MPGRQVVTEKDVLSGVFGDADQEMEAGRFKLASECFHSDPEVGILEQVLVLLRDDERDRARVALAQLASSQVDRVAEGVDRVEHHGHLRVPHTVAAVEDS